MKIKKIDIANKISRELKLTNKTGSQILERFLIIIKSNLNKSKNIKINKFGTFYWHASPKRFGRNPKSKESYIINPRDKINFKPSNIIKKTLN